MMDVDVKCDVVNKEGPSVSSEMVESNCSILMPKSDESVISEQKQELQQQSPPQQQFHQFRAPQEFSKHKVTYLSSAGLHIKKHKTWVKRQHKNGKPHSTNSNIIHHYYNVDIGRDLIKKKTSFTKADLENIQISNQNRNADDKSNCTIEKHKVETASLILRSSDHGQLKQQPFCRKLLSQHKLNHTVCSGAINSINYINATSSNALHSYCENSRESNTINNVHYYTVNSGVGITDFSNSLHHCCIRSRFFLSDKRPRKGNFIPPTKFLFGGNISDPLNLNSLQNESSTNSINNTPISTPRQSPITTPPKVEVLIPPNIRDPLHLLDPVDSMEYEKQLTSPMKRTGVPLESSGKACRNINKSNKNRRKHRKLKRRRFESINFSLSLTPTQVNVQNINTSLRNKSFLELDISLCSGNDSKNNNGSEVSNFTATTSLNKAHIDGSNSADDSMQNTPITNQTYSKNYLKESLHLTLSTGNCNNNEHLTTTNTRKRKLENNLQKTKKYMRTETTDKIVSPIIPLGNWSRQLQPSTIISNNRKSSLKGNPNFLENSDSEERYVNGENSLNIEKVVTKERSDPFNTCTLSSLNNQQSGDFIQTKHKNSNNRDGKYCYGNYNRYKGLRCLNELLDVRLKVFNNYPELFKNKDILDIGCSVGHMTIAVARNLEAKSILGIDIDQKLIFQARRNLSMYVPLPEDLKASEIKTHNRSRHCAQMKHILNANNSYTKRIYDIFSRGNKSKESEKFFPILFPLTYGSILSPNSIQSISKQNRFSQQKRAPSLPCNEKTIGNINSNNNAKTINEFPNNVFFRTTNYVLKNESQLANDVPQYDLILCLSVTKWIHLNFGDNGLKLAFKRMFNQLRPGGKLILEMQNWASYKKDKKLTEKIYNNYKNIELLPYKYHEYLLSTEVGFSHSYTLGVPKHLNKGFSRPLQLYAKGDYTPNHVRWSDAYCPQTPFETQRGIYATMPFVPMANSTYPMLPSNHSQNYNTPQYSTIHSSQQTPYSRQPTPYSRQQTPMHQANTSQYYNPLETDSYLPSYDMDYLNHMYVFASPLRQTVWSPPTNFRHSSSYTPAFGNIGDIDFDADTTATYGFENSQRHVYPPNDETYSPNAQCTNAFNSFRDTDADDLNQLSGQTYQPHVYATNCNEYCSPSRCNQDDRTYAEDVFLNNDDTTTGQIPGSSNYFD